MKSRRLGRLMFGVALAILVVFTSHAVKAALPPGTSVQQWNTISEDTVVGSGAFGNEGLIYMAYVSAAVYDAVVAIEGRYEPYGTVIDALLPGFDDGNPATVEEPGWRPLVATPNHPEYPAAHGSFTSAMAEALSEFLGTQQINVDIHGFDADGLPGNLDAV